MTTIREKLFGCDPYAGFPASDYRVDLQGWGADHHWFRQVIEQIQPRTIIEVGTWKGASAIRMAKIAKEFGLATEILCIDTWLGSTEHVMNRKFDESLRRVSGYPTLYYTFLANVVKNDVQDIITPMPLPSEVAYQVLRRLSVSAELIYIDAGHDYESVKRDLELYYGLLDEKGVLMGDDYIGWTGVTRAVNEFVRNAKITNFAATRGKFIISKTKMRPDFNALADET